MNKNFIREHRTQIWLFNNVLILNPQRDIIKILTLKNKTNMLEKSQKNTYVTLGCERPLWQLSTSHKGKFLNFSYEKRYHK